MVDQLLAPAGEAADILGADDLPTLLAALVHSGGKRIRPVMAHLGWLSASGSARGVGHADVVRVSAALDLLHAFALVHDDVMDESTSRRGVATAHLHAADLHRRTAGQGRPERFGDNIAILLGDLAHAEADALVAGLPAAAADLAVAGDQPCTGSGATSPAAPPGGTISPTPGRWPG